MIQRIFVYCDGVLADFFGSACEAFGYDPAVASNRTQIMSMVKSDPEFWQRIAAIPNFYANLKPYPWTSSLLDYLSRLQVTRGIPFQIVFGQSRVPDARDQRAAWCNKFIRSGFSAYRMGTPRLELVRPHEMPETLLIDDTPAEVDRFNAAGGIGLLFPNGMNGRHEPDPAWWTIEQIGKILRHPQEAVRFEPNGGVDFERAMA